MSRSPQRPAKPMPIRGGPFGMAKIGASRFDWRDRYHLAVSLSWPVFAAAFLGIWLAINLFFALLYVLSPGDIANARPGDFSDCFFFSVETLATVGYGVMAPATLYGHVISAAEIITGTGFTAIITGLMFVRFSRPRSKILFAEDAVVTSFNGAPTLMLRVANGRLTMMTNASARLSLLIREHSAEGANYRRTYHLTLHQSSLPLFFMPWTVMHKIDHTSPLAGHDSQSLAQADAILFLAIEVHDTVLAASVNDLRPYRPDHIRYGQRFADTVSVDPETGYATGDLSRLSLLEPDSAPVPAPALAEP
jgi:inward rectifier potassium channel